MPPQQQRQARKTPEPDEQPAEQLSERNGPPPKKRGKLLLIGSALLVLAAGGGAGFYFMQPAHSEGGSVVSKPAVFLPLEPFTVNLLSDPAQMQFVQTAITLKLSEKRTAEAVKDRLPEVRDRVLIVLSGKKSSELLSVPGKQKLATEISEAIRKVISPAPASADTDLAAAAEPATSTRPAEAQPAAPKPAPTVEVLFTAFIVQ